MWLLACCGVLPAVPAAPARVVGQDTFTARDVAPVWRESASPTVASERQMRIHRGRSQPLPARNGTVRAVVADPTIAGVVPLPSGGWAIVGLHPGMTELATWHAGDPRPQIHKLMILPDSTASAPRRWDPVALERNIRALFPDSHVSLVPLSHELLVKGDAASPDAAASILAYLRSAVARADGAGSSSNIRLVHGTSDERAAAPAPVVRIIDRIDVPAEPSVRIAVALVRFDRPRLAALRIDLNALISERIGTANHAARGVLRGATFEAAELKVLTDWMIRQGAARVVGHSTLTVPAGRTARFLGQEAGGDTKGVSATANATRLTMDVAAIEDRGGIRLNVAAARAGQDTPALDFGTADPGLSIRWSSRFTVEAHLKQGQVLAAILDSDAAASETVLQIPLLGELAPADATQVADGPHPAASTPDLLIMITPEILDSD